MCTEDCDPGRTYGSYDSCLAIKIRKKKQTASDWWSYFQTLTQVLPCLLLDTSLLTWLAYYV